jgi:proliferating cell nuclear antigen
MIVSKNTALLKKSLESISNLIQETNVRFKQDGIYIKAVDKTQILLLDFYFPKTSFDNYLVDPSLVGINIHELYNIISRSFDSDKLKLDLKENSLEINLLGQIDRKFNVSYLDISENEISIPEIKFDSEIIIIAFLLKEILKDINLIGTTVTFKVKDSKFIVECEGDKGKIETTLPKVKIKSKKNVTVKFSLSYLKNITKSIDNDTNILLKLSDDSPLYLEYDIENKVKIKFYLSSMLI